MKPILLAVLLVVCAAFLTGCATIGKNSDDNSDSGLGLGGGGVRYKVPF